jgi:hypothetical protein
VDQVEVELQKLPQLLQERPGKVIQVAQGRQTTVRMIMAAGGAVLVQQVE